MQPFIKLSLFVVMFILAIAAQTQPETEKYYESGTLQFQYNYHNSQLHGITKEYYETGKLKANHHYQEGKLIAKKAFRQDGNPTYELKYEGNKKYETYQQYYSTGELFRQYTLVNGKRDGLVIDFYRNGQKKAERYYINGQRKTTEASTAPSTPCNTWHFKNGKPVADIIFFSTGEKWLVHTALDDNGQLNGISKEYSKDGNLMALRYYKNNEMIKRVRVKRWWGWWYLLEEKIKTAIIITTLVVITLLIGVLVLKKSDFFKKSDF